MLFISYLDLLRLFRVCKGVQGENNDILMDWLKMVHDCMRRYFPEEVTETESVEDPTVYFEVRGVFYVNFSRHHVALRQTFNTQFSVGVKICISHYIVYGYHQVSDRYTA